MRPGVIYLVCVSALAAMAFGWTTVLHAQPSEIDLPPELDRVLRDYEDGWRESDEKALASLFSPDGFIMRPGHPPTQGRGQIEEAYRDSGGPLYLNAYEFAISDSVAYIIGGYSHLEEGPDTGKYILTLKLMSDDRWYITADMDNSNRRRE